MKKILLNLTFAFTAFNACALQQTLNFQESFDFSRLSESETIGTLHVTIGTMHIIKHNIATMDINDALCDFLPTRKEKNASKASYLKSLDTIQQNTPKIEALKKELAELFEEVSALAPSREECHAQQKLLQEQKAALQKTQ